jgi:hypothetical protein
MKKITGSLIAVFLVISLMGMLAACASLSGGPAPEVSVGTPQVKMSKKAEVVLMGKGFKPGQEVNIVLVTTDGVQTDIGYALKPVPKPDETGSWTTTWNAGVFVAKKLVKKGANKILIFDGDYQQLTQGAVVFSE